MVILRHTKYNYLTNSLQLLVNLALMGTLLFLYISYPTLEVSQLTLDGKLVVSWFDRTSHWLPLQAAVSTPCMLARWY